MEYTPEQKSLAEEAVKCFRAFFDDFVKLTRGWFDKFWEWYNSPRMKPLRDYVDSLHVKTHYFRYMAWRDSNGKKRKRKVKRH